MQHRRPARIATREAREVRDVESGRLRCEDGDPGCSIAMSKEIEYTQRVEGRSPTPLPGRWQIKQNRHLHRRLAGGAGAVGSSMRLARPPARPSPALGRAIRSGRAGRWLVTPQLNNGGAIQGTGRNSTPAATNNYDQNPGQMRQIPHSSGGRKMHIASPAYVQGDGSGCLNHGD